MDAIGLNGEDLDVVLMQMVNLMRDGQPVRMSKRTGNAITLTDLLEEVPIDSARFLFNMHDAGSGIDFDLDQAVKTDNDNRGQQPGTGRQRGLSQLVERRWYRAGRMALRGPWQRE